MMGNEQAWQGSGTWTSNTGCFVPPKAFPCQGGLKNAPNSAEAPQDARTPSKTASRRRPKLPNTALRRPQTA